jgi:hypothetical protein
MIGVLRAMAVLTEPAHCYDLFVFKPLYVTNHNPLLGALL